MSTTGPESAEARSEAKRNRDGGAYNMKVGAVQARLSAGISGEYNDNIGISSSRREDDFITTPHLGVDIQWPISQMNTLDLSLGISYAKYMNHPSQDTSTILIKPDSLLDFDFYVKDIHFNLHDRISIQQDPTQLSQLSNLATFRRLENTAGLGAEWDLNTVMLEGGYDLNLFHSLEDRFAFLDHLTHTFKGRVGVRASSSLTVGVLGNYSFTEYDQRVQNNGSSYSPGVFAEAVISEYLRGNATVSFQGSQFDRGGTIMDNSSFSSVVYSFGLQHQLNRFVNHSASYSRFTTLGIGSNFTDTHDLNYQVSLEVIQRVTTGVSFFHQWFEDSASLSAEKGTRFGISPTIGYELSPNTHLSLSYQYNQRDSDLSANDYDQNRVTLDLNHQF